jgi:hypothetical protein
MQFHHVFYRYVTTAAAPAIVALGADTDPRTAYGTLGAPPVAQPINPNTGTVLSPPTVPNVDNVLSSRITGVSAPAAVSRIAVCMVGPTGAANQNANLFSWDSLTGHWYLLNAAPIVLVQNQVLFFDAISLCEGVSNNQQLATQGGADYMLVVAASTPTAGQYAFAMACMLNVP